MITFSKRAANSRVCGETGRAQSRRGKAVSKFLVRDGSHGAMKMQILREDVV